jgi:2-dehydropantoate 2-reductase
MKFLIFGAGALGSVFGGFLSQKNDVALIGRGEHISQINNRGLEITGIWGEHYFSNITTYKSTSEMPDKTFFDLVIITTKAYDTEKAVREIQPLVIKETAVMSMQNGIGNEEFIIQGVGEKRTMGGMAIFGASMKEPGKVEVTVYASECLVGDLTGGISERAKAISKAFSESGIPTKPSEDILRDKWMKAFYNISLNPLSAILKTPYGELGKRKETMEIIKAMLGEAFGVAKASGIELEYTWSEYFDYLLKKQLPPTAAHRSSMLQDIEKGKKTEIDFLNGAIVQRGRKLGVKTPVNETIKNIIKSLEKS